MGSYVDRRKPPTPDSRQSCTSAPGRGLPSAKCRSSAPRSNRRKAVLSPVALTTFKFRGAARRFIAQRPCTAGLERTSPKRAVLAMASHQSLNAGTHIIQKVVERHRHQQRAPKF